MNEIREENSWWKEVPYEDAKAYIKSNIKTMARSFIAVGYYLKQIRDRELYREDGHASIWDFARETYGMSRTTASRWMEMNDRFSEGGNSPVLEEKYQEFGKSQLQEMLYLPEGKLEEAKPEMTVAQIRGLKDQEKRREEEEEEADTLPPCITGRSESGTCEAAAYCINDRECCTGCEEEDCPIRCEHAATPKEPAEKDSPEPKQSGMDPDQNHADPDQNHADPDQDNEKLEQEREETEGTMPHTAHDERWFVRKWAEMRPMERNGVLEAVRCGSGKKGKVAQEYISPYGAKGSSGPGYSFEFRSFSKGIDFKIKKEEMHLSYNQFAKELEVLYPDPEAGQDAPAENDVRHALDVIERAAETQQTGKECATSHTEDFVDLKEGKWEEASEDTAAYGETEEDPDLTPEEMLETSQRTLKSLEKAFGNIPKKDQPHRLAEERIMAEALECLVAKRRAAAGQEGPPKPELPPLKNNDQRKEWLRSYQEWGLWYEDEHIGAKFYKYDFENGARLIAETYLSETYYGDEYEVCYFHLVGGPEPPKEKYGYGRWTRHERYSKNPDCESELIEFLKHIQKKG